MRRAAAHRRSPLFLPALLALIAACQPHRVVRMVDGVPTEGRYIHDIAYAAYLWGSELEAREQIADALVAYALAAAYDPESVEIRVRMAALRCRAGDDERAERTFAEAEAIDARYEPLWRERATCAVGRGAIAEALTHAERAFQADPARVETTLLLVSLLDAAKRHDEAARYLRSLAVRHPHRLVIWQAIAAHAETTGDATWQVEARDHVARLAPSESETPGARWKAVDAALAARDLAAARRAILRAGLDPRLLAARAILVGRPTLALAEAELRLGANPDDADARIALALAADLSGDTARAAALLAALPPSAEAMGAAAQLMMTELLFRRVGRDEASHFLGRPTTSTQTLRRALAETFL